MVTVSRKDERIEVGAGFQMEVSDSEDTCNFQLSCWKYWKQIWIFSFNCALSRHWLAYSLHPSYLGVLCTPVQKMSSIVLTPQKIIPL